MIQVIGANLWLSKIIIRKNIRIYENLDHQFFKCLYSPSNPLNTSILYLGIKESFFAGKKIRVACYSREVGP